MPSGIEALYDAGKPEAGQVEVVVLGVRVRAAHEPVVAVAEVQHRARREDVDVIECDLARHELEPLAGGQVAEVVVVVAVAIVPADAAVHPLFVGQVVIDPDRVVRVLDVLRQRRVLEVARAVGIAGGQRMREILERRPRHGIDQVLRDDVAGERILLEAPVADGAPRERVVDLILRAERQQLREVAVAHLLGRHRRRAVVARPRLVDALEAVHEEGAAPAVVARQDHRPASGAAVAVVVEVGERNVVGVREKVVREQALRRLAEVHGPAQRIGPRLDHQVGHTTFGVPGAGVECRGLDLELLDKVGWRHVRSDDFAGVRRRRARHAVNGQVAAVAARAIHRVADDVRRLERPVETRRARVGDAGCQANERVGITVRRRQLGDAARIDDVAERCVGRLEERRVGGNGDSFDGLADGQRQIDLQPVGDANLDFTRGLLEALQLRGDLIRTGNQVRRLVEPDVVGHDGDGRAHLLVSDGHGRAGDDAAAAVTNGSGDGRARFLGRRRQWTDQRGREGQQGGRKGNGKSIGG